MFINLQARSLPTDKLRPAYIAVNGIVYVIQVLQVITIRIVVNWISVFSFTVTTRFQVLLHSRSLPALIATSDRASGQVCIWIYLGINDNATVELVSKLFIVAVSFVALLGFSVYGGR